MKDSKTNLILIAGGTASGKTKIAQTLFEEINELQSVKTSILSTDYYYRDINDFENKDDINWDHPNTIQWDEMISDIKKIINGEVVRRKKYMFETCSYSEKEFVEIGKTDFLILEGIFSLVNDEIVEMADAKFFVEADDDIRMIRRMIRDPEERYNNKFNYLDFFDEWINKIKPMHSKYILPSKSNAHVIIMNNENDEISIKKGIEIIRKYLFSKSI